MDEKNKFDILAQISSKNIDVQLVNLDTMLDIIYKTQYFRNITNPNFNNEHLQYANLFSQKILLHGHAILISRTNLLKRRRRPLTNSRGKTLPEIP